MKNKNYLRFRYYDLVASLLGSVVWISLTSYIVIIKGNLGINNINILEAITMLVTLIGIKYGFELVGKYSLSTIVFLDTVIESIFLIVFIYLILIDNIYVGITIYAIVMINKFLNPFKREKERHIEDFSLTNSKYKEILKDVRKKQNYIETIGGVIGIGLSMLLVNVLSIDIKSFAITMLCINVCGNIFDYYKWNLYLASK